MNHSQVFNDRYNRILGCLYGQAVGDAFGMPSELWSKREIQQYFGWINTFLDGPKENIAASEFSKGQFTDDTSQAIALMDAIIENDGNINPESIAFHIMAWALRIDAFNKNILGPTSKASLTAIEQGIPIEQVESNGVTNGAPMRISPVGCLIPTTDKEVFIQGVRNACIPTHKSDIAIAGSVVIAWAVSRAVDGNSWNSITQELALLAEEVQECFSSTFSPSLARRINLALKTAKEAENQKSGLNDIYELIGAGMDVIQSVPAAIALVELAETDPMLCAELAANLGGDTDTIGAMATAICGALNGIDAFSQDTIQLINNANQITFDGYAKSLTTMRTGVIFL